MLQSSDRVAFEVVARTHDLCGECPLWVPAQQALLWTDIAGRRAHRYTPQDGTTTLLQQSFEICGLAPHQLGGYTVVNSQGVHHWDGASSLRRLALNTPDTVCFNDCTVDLEGRLLTGSTFFVHGEPYRLGQLFQVDREGRVKVLLEGLRLSNGLAFSPDGDRLYLADSIARRIHVCDYDQASGSAVNWQVLVEVDPSDGMPDGLSVDAAGTLWSAHWYGGCVVQYSALGQEMRRICLPAQQVSSVAFGGIDLRDLYITTAAQPEPGPVPPGYVAQTVGGGDLYRVRVDVPGLEERAAQIPLAFASVSPA